MMATDQDLLAARVVFRAVLPAMKVLIEDDPKFKRKFEGVSAKIQFIARNEPEDVAAYLFFQRGSLEVFQGKADDADIVFHFSSVAKMNAMFAGKPVIPRIKGLRRLGLLAKVMALLMAMKLLLPDAKPKTAEQGRLKVKMTLYMVTTAMSQLNKAGDPEMKAWTSKQPLRIYQWSCEPEGIAAYLKIKAGKSKAGRGYYARRMPFVHMRFSGVDAALPVLANSVDLVKAMSDGLIRVEGSPEYAGQAGNFMVKIAKLLS